jgi:hypothetical protein
MSVDKLKSVSAELTNWFNPVMTQKMIAAVSTPTDISHSFSETEPSVRETPKEPTEPSFLLDETFAIYMLDEDKIADATQSERGLVRIVRNTNRFHHQIGTDGTPTGYARSETQADGTTIICGVFVSDLARAFDSAIKWLLQFERDNPDYVQTKPLVRVLVVPSYQVHAFWLLHEGDGTSDFIVIDAPPEIKGLEGERLLSSAAFFGAFAGVSSRSGLIFDADLTSDPPQSSRATKY